jgi:hypothetical protein
MLVALEYYKQFKSKGGTIEQLCTQASDTVGPTGDILVTHQFFASGIHAPVSQLDELQTHAEVCVLALHIVQQVRVQT